MTVRDLIVKLTETGELNSEVVFGRIVSIDRTQARPVIIKVEPLYPVERLWLGEDESGPFVALLE